MDEVNHRQRVVLSGFGVAASARGMLVFTIALDVQDFTDAGIEKGHTPRLVDGMPASLPLVATSPYMQPSK